MAKHLKKNQYTSLFYSNLITENSLFAVLIRSPISSGTIRSICIENLPENYSLFTADDLPHNNTISVFDTTFPIFAKDKISYKGEPIGILTGPKLPILDDLLQKVEIIFTENFNDQNIETSQENTKIVAKKQISYNKELDLEENFFKEIETQYSLNLKIEESHEPNGAYCTYNEKKLTINTPTQWISNLRNNILSATGLDTKNIIINKTKTPITEKYGPWHNTTLSVQCAIAALLTKKSVLLSLSSTEQNELNDCQNKIIITHKSKIDESGNILEANVSIDVDVGAYNPFAIPITDRLAIASLGPYTAKKLYIEVISHTSDNPPTTSLLRWLDYHCFFAIECHMREIAIATTLSPSEIRFNNTFKDRKDYPFQFDTDTYQKILDIAIKKSDFNRKYTSYSLNPYNKKSKSSFFPVRGIGLATAYEGNGFYGAMMDSSLQSVEVTMEKNAHVIIKVLNESNAIGAMLKELASSILSVETKDITIDNSFLINEDISVPETMLTNMYISSQLIKKACTAVQKQRFREALPISAKRKITVNNKKTWNNVTFTGKPFFATSWIALVAEIELDIFTFSYSIRNIWISIEAGNILNKRKARYAVQNCVKQILTNIFQHQTFLEPNISITFLESNDHPKQIRELVYSTLPCALANAISQVLQQTITEFPINQEFLYKKIAEINKEIFNATNAYINLQTNEELLDEDESFTEQQDYTD